MRLSPRLVCAGPWLVGMAVFAYLVYATIERIAPTVTYGLDGDQLWLVHNLVTVPTFAASMKWWYSDWAGAFHYWRPITSQAFWLEYRVFTLHRPILWYGVSSLSQFTVDVLLALVVRGLTGRWSAGYIAAIAYAGLPGLSTPYDLIPPSRSGCLVGLSNWKDQPDLWVTAAVLGTIAAAVGRHWGLATFCAAIAPCLKENGWVALPFVAAILAIRGELRLVPRWVFVVNTAIVALWVALRLVVGTNVFDIAPVGHNVNWATRYYAAIGGPFFSLLGANMPDRAAMAVAIALAIAAPRLNAPARIALVAAGLAISAALLAFHQHTDFAVGLATATDPKTGLQSALTAAWWLILGIAVLADPRTRAIGATLALFVCACATTLIFGLAVGLHTLYMSNAFGCALYGVSVIALYDAARVRLGMVRASP